MSTSNPAPISDGPDDLGFNKDEATAYLKKATEIFKELFQLVGPRRAEGVSVQPTSDEDNDLMKLMVSLLTPLHDYVKKMKENLTRNGGSTVVQQTADNLLYMIEDIAKTKGNPVVASMDSNHLKLSSFLSLFYKNWLNGEMIDHSLRFISQMKNVLVIPCNLVTYLLSQGFDSKQFSSKLPEPIAKFLKSKNLSEYDAIMGAHHKYKRHWNLLYIHKATQKVSTSLVEPCGEEENETLHTTVAASKVSGIKELLGLCDYAWETHVIDHPTQKDCHNCGVITIKVAELLVEDLPSLPNSLQFSTDSKDLHNLRLVYAEKMLQLERLRRKLFFDFEEDWKRP